jgi:hypothetical protein
MELNTSAEYYKDKVVDIYYRFIRPKGEHDILQFSETYEELLASLTDSLTKNTDCVVHYKLILKMLYKLIAQTRDVCYGKGERDITYMMIYTWWKYYPDMGLFALYSMMFSEYNMKNENKSGFKLYIDTSNVYVPHQNSYGCFKDVKYFCNYVRKYGDKRISNKNTLLCKYVITMLNQRVYDDYTEYCKNGTLPSLACKWVPRENSKYDWIFEQMAIQWGYATNPHILSSVNLEQYDGMNVSFKYVKAVIKCKMIYRKVISQLSKLLDLPETKQCQNKWSEIDPVKLTIDAMFRNSNALFNIDNTFDYREPTIIDKDRRQCAANIKDHIFITDLSPQLKLEKLQRSYINQCTFTPMQFVKQAVKLAACKNTCGSNDIWQNVVYQIGLLNENWKKFSKRCNALELFIPIVDMSLSMVQSNDAIYNAIGMSCLIAEKSRIGQRIMVMDNVPTWVNLDGCGGDFVEMVETLYNYTSKNTVANILKTFDTIIRSIGNSNSNSGDSSSITYGTGSGSGSGSGEKMDLVFVVLTNQTSFWKYENEMIHTLIVDLFTDAKIDIPHIVYWNCSASTSTGHTDDVPTRPVSGTMAKSSMVSGTNAELLNHFSFIGWGDKYNNSAIDTLENILSSSRYDMMDNLFETYFDI